MNDKNDRSKTELETQKIEDKVESLIEHCIELKKENNGLKQNQEKLLRERAQLLEKTTVAKTRVEAMISRLKSMGPGV